MALPTNHGTDVIVETGFRPEHRTAVAAGYWAAFSRKLRYPLGPEKKAIAFLEQVLNPDFAISAVSRSGTFLGVAGFKTPDGAFVAGEFDDMTKAYGWFGGIGRSLLVALLSRKCEPGTLLMDGIFVCPEARGLGVGSALLDAVERQAVNKRFMQVRLDVIDANPRAKKLYLKQGFKVRSQASIGPLQPLFGFRSATTMIKAVA